MSRRRHKGEHHAEAHADERWLVSYADMITVLMCLFLVLFAMSTVDAAKYAQLKDSLATGFGTTPSDSVDAAVGVIVEPEFVNEEGVGFTSDVTDESPLEEAKNEVAQFQEIIEKVNAALTAQGLQDAVEYQIDQRGLTIKLVGGQTFFGSNQATLQPGSVDAIAAIGSALATTAEEISVEGHADPTPASPPWATNWELAAARAVTVLRFMTDRVGIAEARMSAVSFGSSRAIPGDDAGSRRVDIVLHSSISTEAQELVDDVLDGTAEEPADTLADTGDHSADGAADHSTDSADHSTDTSTDHATDSTSDHTTDGATDHSADGSAQPAPTGPRVRGTAVDHSGDPSSGSDH